MIKKFKFKKQFRLKQNLLHSALPTFKPCSCSRKFNDFNNLAYTKSDDSWVLIPGVWTPDRCISTYQELMAVTNEPIFITGRSDWQSKEINANTRELGICKHFMKRLDVEYLGYFIQELLRRKQECLKLQAINDPVTCYLWYYYGSDCGGRAFLCYDFISGQNIDLPFGRKPLHDELHMHTFIRKFLAHKSKKYNSRKFHVITYVLNKEKEGSMGSQLSDEQCNQLYETFSAGGNFKPRLLPREIMK